jgi:ribA/ribD-fused uncharacterized protein
MDVNEEKGAKRLHSQLTPTKAGEMDMDKGVMAAMEASMESLLEKVLQRYGLDTIKQDIVDLQKSVEHALNTGEEAKLIAHENKSDIAKLKTELEETKQQLTYEHEARLKQECQSRRSNLKFHGVPEEVNETDAVVEQTILTIINQTLRLNVEDMRMERCHRMGRKGSQTRPIIVKFSFFKDRELVWMQKKNLKGTSIFLKEDFPPEMEKRRSILLPVFLAAKKDKNLGKVNLVMDKLYINNVLYTADTVHRLPVNLKPENLATHSNNSAVWFWRRASVFSNHHESPFIENGKHYNCAEQYLMEKKADTFGDREAAAKIMATKNPVVQKQTKVNGYSSVLWQQVATDIMKQALRLKFSQNQDLKQKLLATGKKHIGEASPHDNIYGCGLSMNDPNIGDFTKWKGQNKLGKQLMEVRSLLES